MENSHSKTLTLTYIALSAALIAICSWISIPTTVPFTLQTFAVCLVAGLLGVKRGVLAVIVFICLGAVGFPVFANFSGGLGVISVSYTHLDVYKRQVLRVSRVQGMSFRLSATCA